MTNKRFAFKKIYRIFAVIITVALLLTFGTAGTYSNNDMINEVRYYLKNFYVEKLPDSVINQPTVDDIIKEINKKDPYTTYFTAAQYKEFMNYVDNKFTGIGVYIEIVPQGVKITSLIEGGPAGPAGVEPGDIIFMADNHILAGLSSDQALGYVKGPENTTVRLTILRGTKVVNISVVRKLISAPTVVSQILDNHIGYISISSFGENTPKEFADKLNELQKEHADSYIIDLRNNLGGILDSAFDMAGYFIGNNLALITKGQYTGVNMNKAVFHGKLINRPVVFLINENSASASEVLSSAVKDYGKAYFIGEKSFGKGCVQVLVPLPNKDVLKFTLDNFYSPKGHVINKVGITPDFVVPDSIDSMRAAELLLDSHNYPKESQGYIKVSFGKKSVTLKSTRAEDPVFWQSYGELVTAATTSGAISIGSKNGWSTVSKTEMKDRAKMYFPYYNELPKLAKAGVDPILSIDLNAEILNTSDNNKNVELIDAQTGSRIPIYVDNSTRGLMVVMPVSKLEKNKSYFLTVSPKLVKADNKYLGHGIIEEIQTTK